jgi:hypothetical protein
LIAGIACETGIGPTELMNLEPRMLWTLNRYLVHRKQTEQRSQRKR